MVDVVWFQCSSASRKFLNPTTGSIIWTSSAVSVLFSEPKIPQSTTKDATQMMIRCFSALQRAENSSMFALPRIVCVEIEVSVLFSEPKIPQCVVARSANERLPGFSALQRAENSSMLLFRPSQLPPPPFQCSSASRKFLNYG